MCFNDWGKKRVETWLLFNSEVSIRHMPELPQWRCLAQGQVTVHVDKNQCSYQQQLYIYAQHEWEYNVTLLCFTHGYIYTVLLRSILPTLVLSLAVWFPTYSVWARTQAHLLYSDTQSTPVTFMFPLTHDAWWKKKNNNNTVHSIYHSGVGHRLHYSSCKCCKNDDLDSHSPAHLITANILDMVCCI